MGLLTAGKVHDIKQITLEAFLTNFHRVSIHVVALPS
jgi:hypothetical protein